MDSRRAISSDSFIKFSSLGEGEVQASRDSNREHGIPAKNNFFKLSSQSSEKMLARFDSQPSQRKGKKKEEGKEKKEKEKIKKSHRVHF